MANYVIYNAGMGRLVRWEAQTGGRGVPEGSTFNYVIAGRYLDFDFNSASNFLMPVTVLTTPGAKYITTLSDRPPVYVPTAKLEPQPLV
jgi:hypothetical protein